MATDFEGYTHEQLLAMIASLDAETVKARATQLSKAAEAIKQIGESLKKHQVKGWEGEAAQAFRDWVSRAGSATLRLGEYSAEGSKWMTHAAQTMIEVKANTPKYDASAAANLEAAHRFHNDPDAQQMGQTAHSKLTGDHHEAVQQLTKLAQSYEASTTQLTRAEIPTFPPPPADFDPVTYNRLQYVDREGGAGSGASGGSYAPSASYGGGGAAFGAEGASGQRSAAAGTPSSGGPGPTPVLPDRAVEVGLDHVGSFPQAPPSPVSTLPGGGPTLPGGAPSSVPPMPPLSLPPTRGLPSAGGGSLPGGRPPSGLSGKAGLPPRDAGIVGGRPVSAGPSGAGLPRGTVIGAEGTQPVGRGMGGPMGGGVGGPQGPRDGSPAGRRLATQPGGVVGGRQAGASGQPFTQGGSGLVRNGSGPGAGGRPMGHGGAGTPTSTGRRKSSGSGRPDYLAEDEETWQGDRRVVPPVID